MGDGKTKSNFIEAITFESDFAPFKGGDKVFLGGEAQMQKLIEFYLKSKTNYSHETLTPENNVKRFKVNCVLGNNGGGKSSLLEAIDYNDKIRRTTSYEHKVGCEAGYSTVNQYFKKGDYTYGKNPLLELQSIYELSSQMFSLLGNPRSRKAVSSYVGGIFRPKETFLKLNFPQYKRASSGETSSPYMFEGIDVANISHFIRLFQSNLGYGEQFFSNQNSFISFIYQKLSGEEQKRFYNYCIMRSGIVNKMIKYIEEPAHQILIKESLLREFEDDKKILNIMREDDLLDAFSQTQSIENVKLILRRTYEEVYNLGKTGLRSVSLPLYEKMPLMNNYELKLFGGKWTELFCNKDYSIVKLSSGEKSILSRFSDILFQLIASDSITIKTGKFLILIDEPDLHLHLDWQKKYIQKLIDVFSTLPEDIHVHFILATHSPFIISDLPTECIVKLDGKNSKTNKTDYTKITTYDDIEHSSFNDFDEFKEHTVTKKTFGANYVDIINDGFFFDDKVLMGGFAESIVGDVAKNDRNKIMETDESKEDDFDAKVKAGDDLKKQIGDEYLKDNLLYFVKGKKDD